MVELVQDSNIIRGISMKDFEKTVLKCSECGGNASVNTPGIDEDGNIICHICLDKMRDNKLRFGIKQRSDEDGTLQPSSTCDRFYNGHTLVFYPNENWTRKDSFRYGIKHPHYSISAYTNDGAVFPLTTSEEMIAIGDPFCILNMMDEYISTGEFRCTTCHGEFKIEDIGGRPLFAGKVCKKCWEKHIQDLHEEKKKGHVCSMCGEPYGNCCC